MDDQEARIKAIEEYVDENNKNEMLAEKIAWKELEESLD